MKKEKRSGYARAAGMILTAVLCFFFFFTALSNLEKGSGAQGRLMLEDALRKTAAACYATEGAYPPDVGYMETHYGLQVDRERYIVHYEIFASNLMPQITVIERGT